MRAILLASLFGAALAAACSSNGSQTTPDGGGGAGGAGGADAGPPPNFGFDWNGVVGTGQSLSVGGLGTPIVAHAAMPAGAPPPSFNNLKLSLGGATVPPFDATLSQLAMIPLFEPIRPDFPVYPQAYPGNIDGETPHTAMSFQVTSAVMAAAMRDYVTVHTVVGESGQGIIYLKKGAMEVVNGQATQGRAYAATLFEAQAITRLAAAAGKTYGIGAITLIHGESDAGSSTYENDMFQLWSDYNADLPMITGQTTSIPMLVSQQNSVPTNLGSGSAATIAQWKIGVDHPGDIVCIGPKYQYPYLQDSSGYIHLSAAGYELLGEKYGQVYYERVIAGHDWQPLQPDPARPPEVSGQEITVHFHVPVPPLRWDESFPQPHVAIAEWALGRGFEVRAASNPATITAVDIVGDDSVKITVQNDLTGLQVQVGYALSTEGTTIARTQGHSTFRWGQLVDSDPFVGAFTGTPQPNYGVTFQLIAQ